MPISDLIAAVAAMPISDLASAVTAAAAALTFAVALAALIIAARQIRASREIAAYDAYEAYHHLMLEHADLGVGHFDYRNATALDRDRYLTFVLSMLLTVERIVVLFRGQRSWRAALEDDIETHAAFICSDAFRPYRRLIEPEVVRLIDNVERRRLQADHASVPTAS